MARAEISKTELFEDGKLVWKNIEKEWLNDLLNEPIIMLNEVIDPKKEPEKFIRNLGKAYSGSYFRASKPIIYK